MKFYNTRAFIFDMDGTLVDNMRFHTEAWGKMLEENGVQMNAHDFLVKTAGKTNREIMPTVFGEISDERIARHSFNIHVIEFKRFRKRADSFGIIK